MLPYHGGKERNIFLFWVIPVNQYTLGQCLPTPHESFSQLLFIYLYYCCLKLVPGFSIFFHIVFTLLFVPGMEMNTSLLVFQQLCKQSFPSLRMGIVVGFILVIFFFSKSILKYIWFLVWMTEYIILRRIVQIFLSMFSGVTVSNWWGLESIRSDRSHIFSCKSFCSEYIVSFQYYFLIINPVLQVHITSIMLCTMMQPLLCFSVLGRNTGCMFCFWLLSFYIMFISDFTERGFYLLCTSRAIQ
jgi:hypothetical protein